jgi:hypothetical protein
MQNQLVHEMKTGFETQNGLLRPLR